MSKKIMAIVEAPDIILDDDEKAGDSLLKFYRALGWNGEDYLDPSKVRTSKTVYDKLYEITFDKCPDPVGVGMHMANLGPSVDDRIPIGQVWLLEGWTAKTKSKREE